MASSSEGLVSWFDSQLRQSTADIPSRRRHRHSQSTRDAGASASTPAMPPPSLSQFPVAIDMFPCGSGTVRGLRATSNIQKGDVILRIPYQCFITAEGILKTLAPQLELDVREIERRLEDAGLSNLVTVSMPQASTILHSCETVIVLFLLTQRYGAPLSSHQPFAPYIASLPPMLTLSTPEFLFLLECDTCPAVYIDGDAEVQAYRAQHSSRMYSRDQLCVLLGSKVRFQKLTRRVERYYLRFAALQSVYLSSPASSALPPTWLQSCGSSFTFPQWLWASHMINSRTFMYRRPSWSQYPKCYEDGYDEDEDDDGSGSNSSDDGDGDDAILLAIDKAKATFREQREQGSTSTGGVTDIQRRASAVASDEGALRKQKIGGGGGGGGCDVDESSSSDDDTSSDTSTSDEDDEDEPDLLTMVPFVDLLNHDNELGTTNFTFEKHTSALVIKADRPIFEGEQVFLKYNNMDHWRFAKYYGFVPDSSAAGGEASPAPTATDAIPIAVPLPPSINSVSTLMGKSVAPTPSIVAVTKAQLFEGPALKKHCYVTKRGANQQLQSVLRLAFLGAEDLDKYTSAYDKPPLSIRNEWHVYEYLKSELALRRMEIERNVKINSKSLPQGLTCRGMTAVAVRSRDLSVATDALQEVKKRFEDLCGLLYFGASTSSTLRTHVIHDQFRELKAMGRLPMSEEEQKKAGLGLLPSMVPGARFSVPEYTDVLFDRLQKRLERAQRPVLPAYVDPHNKK